MRSVCIERNSNLKRVRIETRIFTEVLITHCFITLYLNNRVKRCFMNKNLFLLMVKKHYH